MITITNQTGHTLELSAGTVIPVERNNALFSEPGKFVQDITLPGTAGLTENNIIFIQNGHLVESSISVYEFPVTVDVDGSAFFAGLFTYEIQGKNIKFNLKVNFGAVAEKVKSTSIRDIYTLDPIATVNNTITLENLMKDTCLNPLNHNMVFFPVANARWRNDDVVPTNQWINFWAYEDQKFLVNAGGIAVNNTCEVPFFRLLYIVKKVIESLKFTVTGSAFTDLVAQSIYLFSRRGIYAYGFAGIEQSSSYLPDMKITDLLKQVNERLHWSIEFDVFNNEAIIDTPESILNSPEVLDITQWIEKVEEITVAEKKGYEITLKVDDTDDAWNTGTADQKVFKAPYKLHIGQSENKIEMAIGTLRNFDDPDITEFSYPLNEQVINRAAKSDLTTWPLRLMQYTGMRLMSDGKYFPEGRPLDLTLSDAIWPKFLNDSKPLIIYANVPAEVLAKMKPTRKLGCVSNEGLYFIALPSKISYELKNDDAELIRVKIEARRILLEYDTPAYIETVDTKTVTGKFITEYKAYFDPKLQNISEVIVKRVALSDDSDFGYTPITSPTNDVGSGGTIGTNFLISGNRNPLSEERVYSKVPPKYYVKGGYIGYFTAVADYYRLNPLGVGTNVNNDKPVWIVF